MVTQESIELCQSVKSHALQAETDCITSVTMTDSALGVFLRAQANKKKRRLSGHWLAEGGAQVKEATKDPVLMDVVRDWYENVVYLEQPTWLRTRSVLRALDGFFGEMRISQVNGKVIKEYVASRQPRSSGTVRLELQKIRTAFNWACTRKEPRDERLRREELPWIELPSASAPRNTVVERQLLAQMRDNAIDMALGLDRPFGIYLLRSSKQP